jgi:DNA/RNA-binding domain of Phe-tRNA-synthetase-like protein
MQIQVELPGVKLGVLEADSVRVVPVREDLAREMDTVSDHKRRNFTLESLAASEPMQAVRSMFRCWEMDPSKYRPSSEALLRRVVQGKGLYRVCNVVDACNLGSIETGWPYGCYDRQRIQAPIAFRHGLPGERYEGIGKKVWHLEGRPVLADPGGPFGSPISDSTRSMITESTKEIMAVIYVPTAALDSSLQAGLESLSSRLSRFAEASNVQFAIYR